MPDYDNPDWKDEWCDEDLIFCLVHPDNCDLDDLEKTMDHIGDYMKPDGDKPGFYHSKKNCDAEFWAGTGGPGGEGTTSSP